MTKANQSKQRSKVLLDPKLQVFMVARLGLRLLASLFFFLALAIVTPIAVGYLEGAPAPGIQEAMRRIDSMSYVVLLPILATFLCLFAQGFLETFRIAGPAYRFREVFERVQRLCIPNGLRIRSADYLQDAAKSIDEGLQCVHRELREIRTLAHEIEEAVSESRNGDAASYRRAREAAGQLTDALSRFELVGAAPGYQVFDGEASPLPEIAEPMESAEMVEEEAV